MAPAMLNDFADSPSSIQKPSLTMCKVCDSADDMSLSPSQPPSLENISSIAWDADNSNRTSSSHPVTRIPDTKVRRRTSKCKDDSTRSDPPDIHEEISKIKARRQQLLQRIHSSNSLHSDAPPPLMKSTLPKRRPSKAPRMKSLSPLEQRSETPTSWKNASLGSLLGPSKKSSFSPNSSLDNINKKPTKTGVSSNRRPSLQRSNDFSSSMPNLMRKSSDVSTSRPRPQSPHPAQILEDRAMSFKQKSKGGGQIDDSPIYISDNDDEDSESDDDSIPSKKTSPVSETAVLALTNASTPSFLSNLDSKESAEELKQLIEAMQKEFDRLRSAKMQAEAKAEKLETDLVNIQQTLEAEVVSVSTENERLKREASEHKIKLEQVSRKASDTEKENRLLKIRLGKASSAKAEAESKVTTLEEENQSIRKSLAIFIGKSKQIQRRRHADVAPCHQ